MVAASGCPGFSKFFWSDALFAFFTAKRQRAFDIVPHAA